jgi:hypothetical protein
MDRHLPELPLIDRVKIQAEVLVPLVRQLQAELGAEAAERIVRAALSETWRAEARRLVAEYGSSSGALMAHAEESARGDPLTIEWHELTDQSARLEVTRCEYARFYRDELGAPDIGHLVVCENDDWLVEGLGDVAFERHQTIMQGADRCDFCYKLETPANTEVPSQIGTTRSTHEAAS